MAETSENNSESELNNLLGRKTQLERTLSQLNHKIDTGRAQLQSQLSQIGESSGRGDIEEVHISPQKFMRRGDMFGHMKAKKANTTARNIQSHKQRREQIQGDLSRVESRISEIESGDS